MVKNCLNIDNIKICIYLFNSMVCRAKKQLLLKSTNNIGCLKKPIF